MASQSQPRGSPLVAAVHTDERGFLAAIRDGARCFLIADVGRGIASDPPTLGIAIDGAEGAGALLDAVACTSTLARIHAYLDSTRATAAIDFAAAASARARRDALTRVARALARTPRHRRALVAPLADAARAVATAPLGEGAERILEVLVRAELPDEAWLRSLATFAALNTRSHVPRTHTPPEIVALILFASHPGRTRADGKAD
jgi:hypothetical protein